MQMFSFKHMYTETFFLVMDATSFFHFLPYAAQFCSVGAIFCSEIKIIRVENRLWQKCNHLEIGYTSYQIIVKWLLYQ